MKLVGRLTTRQDDLPVPDNTEGGIRRLVDDSFVATVATSGGWFTYEQNGSPGPFKIDWDHAGVVKEQYSTVMGPSGPVDISSIPLVFRSFTDGVIQGVSGDLAVTATGSNMNIGVAAGSALVKGIVYDHRNSSAITIATAPSAPNSRIDRLVVRVVPPGNPEEGRSELILKQGTPASSPVAPTLTQTNEMWEISLATILVGSDVIVIGSDKVGDTRSFSAPNIPDGGITNAMLAHGSVTTLRLADNAVTTPKISDGSVTSPKLASNSVTSTKLADASVTNPKIANLAVSGGKIAANAITGGHLNDNLITQFMLQDNAVVAAKIASNAVTAAKIASNAVETAKIADNAITTAKISNSQVTEAKLSGAVQIKLNASGASASVLMPGTEFVATGPISSGSRTLVTMAVGPLQNGVTYAILVYSGVTLRNQGSTGTVIVRTNINAGTQRTHEMQNVGGVPRWAPVTQTAAVLGAGSSINVTGSVVYNSGDPTDVRAGWIQAVAIPINPVVGS